MAVLIDAAIQRSATAAPDPVMGMLAEVGHLPQVARLLQEKSYTDWALSQFEASYNFEQATKYAGVVAKIASSLNDPQVIRVFQAIASNGQILDSYGAKNCLTGFVALHKNKVDPTIVKKILGVWGVG